MCIRDRRVTHQIAALEPRWLSICWSALADFGGSRKRRLLCGDNRPLSVQGQLTGYCSRLDRVKSTLFGRWPLQPHRRLSPLAGLTDYAPIERLIPAIAFAGHSQGPQLSEIFTAGCMVRPAEKASAPCFQCITRYLAEWHDYCLFDIRTLNWVGVYRYGRQTMNKILATLLLSASLTVTAQANVI